MPNNLIIGYGQGRSKPKAPKNNQVNPMMPKSQNEEANHNQDTDNKLDEIDKLQKKLKKYPKSKNAPKWKKEIKELSDQILAGNRHYVKWNEPNSLVPRQRKKKQNNTNI